VECCVAAIQEFRESAHLEDVKRIAFEIASAWSRWNRRERFRPGDTASTRYRGEFSGLRTGLPDVRRLPDGRAGNGCWELISLASSLLPKSD
jgi:hypothetical protein